MIILRHNLVILIFLFRLHWTRNIMKRPLIVDALLTTGRWLLLFTSSKNCFILSHKRQTAQWPGYGAVLSWHHAYFWHVFLLPARKNIPGSFLKNSSFFRTTSRCWLQIPGRQLLLDPNPSWPSKFKYNQMSLFEHVPVIFDLPVFC